MSLILEALKKSEQQRRLGEAPTLGTPVFAARRRRSRLPLLGALIVLALGAGWWFLRTPRTPVAPVDQTALADATAKSHRGSTPAHVELPAAADRAERRTAVDASAKAAAPARTAPAAAPSTAATPPTAAAPAIIDRGPAPTRPHPVIHPAANGPVLDRPGSVVALPPAPPSVAGPNVKPALAPGAAPVPAPHVGAPAKPATNVPAPVAATPRTASAPPASAARTATDKPGVTLPQVWELPYATRKDLPDLTLTLHVYAADPQQRFVVIRGERHVEGDDLGDGVTLHEIRPDGVVLEFKNQEFVYPRDGR